HAVSREPCEDVFRRALEVRRDLVLERAVVDRVDGDLRPAVRAGEVVHQVGQRLLGHGVGLIAAYGQLAARRRDRRVAVAARVAATGRDECREAAVACDLQDVAPRQVEVERQLYVGVGNLDLAPTHPKSSRWPTGTPRLLPVLRGESAPTRGCRLLQPRTITDSVNFVNRAVSLLIESDRSRTIARMLAVERRRRIAENLRTRGVISVADMATMLGTTEITVRRDMRAMARDGLLVRAHGGAVLPAAIGHEPSYSEKAHQAASEKAAIARLAVQLILPGDSILLGPGTTTLALARLLIEMPELTVVTNS